MTEEITFSGTTKREIAVSRRMKREYDTLIAKEEEMLTEEFERRRMVYLTAWEYIEYRFDLRSGDVEAFESIDGILGRFYDFYMETKEDEPTLQMVADFEQQLCKEIAEQE